MPRTPSPPTTFHTGPWQAAAATLTACCSRLGLACLAPPPLVPPRTCRPDQHGSDRSAPSRRRQWWQLHHARQGGHGSGSAPQPQPSAEGGGQQRLRSSGALAAWESLPSRLGARISIQHDSHHALGSMRPTAAAAAPQRRDGLPPHALQQLRPAARTARGSVAHAEEERGGGCAAPGRFSCTAIVSSSSA